MATMARPTMISETASTSALTTLMINVGSTSVKFALAGPAGWRRWGAEWGDRSLEGLLSAAAESIVARHWPVDVVVHRVVHGGSDHDHAELIDDRLLAALAELAPFAPLHQSSALEAIASARRFWPVVPQVACYDTAFHRRAGAGADRLPIPDRLHALGIRRYGFHGLSLQSVVDRLPGSHQAVVAHLGGGCSVTAVADGRPRFTTMSVTPTSGIPSATRSGDLDPDALLALIDHFGFSVGELRHMINFESGLTALSGGIADHRELVAAAATSIKAAQALEAFVRSVAMAIMSAATTLDCWDQLIFTGGIGECAGSTREAICRLVAATRGRQVAGDESASQVLADAGVRVLTLPADEEQVMDRQAREVLGALNDKSNHSLAMKGPR